MGKQISKRYYDTSEVLRRSDKITPPRPVTTSVGETITTMHSKVHIAWHAAYQSRDPIVDFNLESKRKIGGLNPKRISEPYSEAEGYCCGRSFQG